MSEGRCLLDEEDYPLEDVESKVRSNFSSIWSSMKLRESAIFFAAIIIL